MFSPMLQEENPQCYTIAAGLKKITRSAGQNLAVRDTLYQHHLIVLRSEP